MKLTSILIPCYNAEAYVSHAIESASAQDYPEVEVVAPDDCSTDVSLAETRRDERDPGFRWESGGNRGGNAARNRPLELTRCEYVQWLDTDDTLTYKKVLRLVNQHSNARALRGIKVGHKQKRVLCLR